MTDQGRSALSERLKTWHPQFDDDAAAAILGEHGLFIADASKHEPRARDYDFLACSCGWRQTYASDESYFDHIGAP